MTLCRPGWPQTMETSCLCLPSPGRPVPSRPGLGWKDNPVVLQKTMGQSLEPVRWLFTITTPALADPIPSSNALGYQVSMQYILAQYSQNRHTEKNYITQIILCKQMLLHSYENKTTRKMLVLYSIDPFGVCTMILR